MSQAGVVTRLAVRELWITFRMLLLLATFVGVGAAIALLPASPVVTLERLAMGLAAATGVASGVAGWSLGAERTSGRAGWLVTRAVSRATYLSGWFASTLAIACAGLVGAATLGWMAVAAVPGPDAIGYVGVIGAIAADVAAAVALGLLAGAVATPPLAALAGVGACGLVAAAHVLVPLPEVAIAFALLPRVGAAAGELVAASITAAGVGLAAAGTFLTLARVAMARADL